VNRREHWDTIFRTRDDADVSWFEAYPTVSLQMIDAAGVTRDSCIIDIGGGRSRLIDALLARNLTCLAVLDISHEALDQARQRLGDASTTVTWIESDVTGPWSLPPVDIWHDRAVFHFLVDADDRRRYVAHLHETVKAGGSAVIATFSPDGPEKCSGLPVARYSPEALATELGSAFTLTESRFYEHTTPSGAVQAFQYSRLRRVNSPTVARCGR